MDLLPALAAHLRAFTASPYLFVGSGLSRRYLGLETWDGLLRRFASELDFDYSYFLSKGASYLPRVASLIAEHYHRAWFTNDRFAENRARFAAQVTDITSPLRISISRYLCEKNLDTERLEPHLVQEIEQLRQATVDGIITTNWDSMLESIFSEYKPYVGQDSLIFHPITGIGEIYKVHGCSSSPASLILTEDDYRRFEGKNPYLAAKLTTIFVEHPVLFLGYSGADSNIRKILGALTHCLGPENTEKLRDRLIFVEWVPGSAGSIQPSEITVMEADTSTIIPVTKIRVDGFLPVYQALSESRRRIPARILRQLKEQVYDLVLNNDPHGLLHVKDLESDRDPSEIQIVYGVGVVPPGAPTSVGYRGLHREAIVFDVIYDDGEPVRGEPFRKPRLRSDLVIQEVLPELLKTTPWVPVHKYIREAGFGDTRLDDPRIDQRIRRAMNHDWKKVAKSYRPIVAGKGYTSIAQVLQDLGEGGFMKARYYIPHLPHDKIDSNDLLRYIKGAYSRLGWTDDSLIRILVCLYDHLVYGTQRGAA
ncbi:SIR2 family protein [Nannocystis pusilla]|uniref:SIR2 family protein n=1 Tax=Nannocystis pusilla TaxID=889268 RepID=UPI003B7BFD3B